MPVTGGHVRASSGCSTATFHTVSGSNFTWPSDNGAGKDMRAFAICIYLRVFASFEIYICLFSFPGQSLSYAGGASFLFHSCLHAKCLAGSNRTARSSCPIPTFHTVSGSNFTWPSDNGAGNDMRAFAIYIYLCLFASFEIYICLFSLPGQSLSYAGGATLLARQPLSGIKQHSITLQYSFSQIISIGRKHRKDERQNNETKKRLPNALLTIHIENNVDRHRNADQLLYS